MKVSSDSGFHPCAKLEVFLNWSGKDRLPALLKLTDWVLIFLQNLLKDIMSTPELAGMLSSMDSSTLDLTTLYLQHSPSTISCSTIRVQHLWIQQSWIQQSLNSTILYLMTLRFSKASYPSIKAGLNAWLTTALETLPNSTMNHHHCHCHCHYNFHNYCL